MHTHINTFMYTYTSYTPILVHIYTHTDIQVLRTSTYSSAIHEKQQPLGPLDRWAGVIHSRESGEYVTFGSQKPQMHCFPSLPVGGN